MRRALRKLLRRLGFTEVSLGNPALVSRLGRQGVPLNGCMLDYVERVIPSSDLDLGELRILGAEAFLDLNLMQEHAGKVVALGFWILATMSGGDYYVFDLEEERIRMLDACQLLALIGAADGQPLTRSSIEAIALDQGEDLEEFVESIVDLYAS